MKFKIVYNAWWMRKGWAMVFLFWMFVGLPQHKFTDRHYRHELQHCYQVRRKGRFMFYLTYAFYWFKHGMFWGGYRNNPYEVEAREKQYEPLSAEEIAWRKRGKIHIQ